MASSSGSAPSLSEVVKEHRARRAQLVADNEQRKKEAVDSVQGTVDATMDSLNQGVATVWHNQQQLEVEAKALQQHVHRFSKQTGKWLTTFNKFSDSLKALGDVQNWARALESDMTFINSSLEQLQHAREQQAAAEGPVDFRFQISGGSDEEKPAAPSDGGEATSGPPPQAEPPPARQAAAPPGELKPMFSAE